MAFFIVALLVYGISNIIVFSKITEGFRTYLSKNSRFFFDLFSCMMCTAFWVGFFIYGVIDVRELTFVNNIFINSVLAGFLFSGTTWLIHTGQEYLERAN